MALLFLLLAVVAEVIGTLSLKATAEFSKLGPTLVIIAAYNASLYLFTLALRSIPVGIAYAIWSGLGVALVAGFDAIVNRQVPDGPAVAGMGMIVAGVVCLNVLSRTAGH